MERKHPEPSENGHPVSGLRRAIQVLGATAPPPAKDTPPREPKPPSPELVYDEAREMAARIVGGLSEGIFPPLGAEFETRHWQESRVRALALLERDPILNEP